MYYTKTIPYVWCWIPKGTCKKKRIKYFLFYLSICLTLYLYSCVLFLDSIVVARRDYDDC